MCLQFYCSPLKCPFGMTISRPSEVRPPFRFVVIISFRRVSNICLISCPLSGVVKAALTLENSGASHKNKASINEESIRGRAVLTRAKSLSITRVSSMREYNRLVVFESIFPNEEIVPVSDLLVLRGGVGVIHKHHAVRLVHDGSPAGFVSSAGKIYDINIYK